MQSVEFIKPWKIYSPGDIAGFEADQAKRLIDGGAAKEAAVEEAKAEEKAAKTAK